MNELETCALARSPVMTRTYTRTSARPRPRTRVSACAECRFHRSPVLPGMQTWRVPIIYFYRPLPVRRARALINYSLGPCAHALRSLSLCAHATGKPYGVDGSVRRETGSKRARPNSLGTTRMALVLINKTTTSALNGHAARA